MEARDAPPHASFLCLTTERAAGPGASWCWMQLQGDPQASLSYPLMSGSSPKMDVRDEGSGERGIESLAPETLARIFAFLDPVSLSRCARTCRAWNVIVSQDTTWCSALMCAFGLEEREERIAAAEHGHDPAWKALRVAPALRRMKPSWRSEYMARSALLRRWRKSRMPTVLTDPRIGGVDALALSSSRKFVLSLSYGFSIASRSNALTGKVAKDFLDAHGFASHGPNGQPNMEFSPAATAMATDAYASRIIWGLRSGDISITTIDWRGQSARGTVQNRSMPVGAAHRAPVSAIGLPCPLGRGGAHSDERHRQQLSYLGELSAVFATASSDGTVLLWHPKHLAPLCSLSARVSDPDQPCPPQAHRITHLELDPVAGVLAAAREDGRIVVWTHLLCSALVATSTSTQAHAASPFEDVALPPRRHVLPAPCSGEVAHMVLDALDARQDRAALLVHYQGACVFWRYDIDAQGATLSAVFGAPHISPLTSVRCDFDVRSKPLALPGPMRARLRAARLQERKFVCAGTASGGIGVWEWDATGELFDPEVQPAWQSEPVLVSPERQVRPAHVYDGHHNAVTALACTPSLILAGCEDGTIKALDVLSGTLVRVFNERTAKRHPARMLAAGELTPEEAARFRVTHIVAADDMFVAAIGLHVLSWKTHKDDSSLTTPAAGANEARSAPRRAKALLQERGRQRADLHQAVEEGRQQVRSERMERHASQAKRHALETSIHGALDEDAALDYALMLSREQAQVDEELSAELMYDLDLDVNDGDSDAVPLSPPLPPHDASAPPLSASTSRAWDILHTAGRSATITSESHPGSWSKLRTVSVPRHVRLARSTSPSLGTSPASFGSLSSLADTSLAIESPDEWPHMPSDPSRASRSPLSLSGAWAYKSPTLRAVDAPQADSARRAGRCALWEPAPSQHVSPMDDDLRLAMELSLAEYEASQSPKPDIR